MRYQRWFLAPLDVDGTPKGVHRACRAWSIRHIFENNLGLFEAEFESDELINAQSLAAVTVFPSLNTPADRLPQKVLDWLSGHGIVLGAGDTVLNVLRSLRDKFAEKFPIDLPI